MQNAPTAALLRACAAVRDARFTAAAAELDWVLGRSHDPDLRLLAGRLAACLGQYDRSLSELSSIAAGSSHQARPALEAALELTLRLGWDQDTRRLLEPALKANPQDTRLHRIAVRLYGRRAPELAIEHARRALSVDPTESALRMELAGLAAEIGDSAEVTLQVQGALARNASRPYLLEAARILFDIADVDGARKLLEELSNRDPKDAAASSALARLELAAGRHIPARELAERVLTAVPDDAMALSVMGALSVIAGRSAGALPHLDRALEQDRSLEDAFCWRAEARLALGDSNGCRDDAHRASMLGGHHFPARLLHLLASTGPNDRAPRVYAMRLENVREALLELCPGSEPKLASELHAEVVPVLEQALRRLGSNRTTSPTWIDDAGRLRRLMARGGVRSACRAALERIRCQPAKTVSRLLDELVERYPDSSLPRCHRGELQLWLGDVTGARADFEAAIAHRPETRFAYIGLAGCALLDGDAERALAECERGVEVMHGSHGPAVFAYRGEALLELGRLDEAIEDLDRAIRESPTRLGSRIAAAIARAARDGAPAVADAYDEIESLAPALVADAADGVVAPSYRAAASPAQRLAILERARQLLRGNRSSSCYTYFSPRGELRSVPGRAQAPTRPGAREGSELDRIEAALHRRLARDRERSPARQTDQMPPEPTVPAPLSNAEVELFLQNGYLALRGAIPPEVCAKLVDRLHVRLTTAPERWVRRADSATLTALLRLSPEDPASWPAARLDVEGERAIPIAELSPRLWAAVCQLLGGPERVATSAFFDAFVLNLRDLTESEWVAPSKTQDSWHYDDPGPKDRLDELRRGLIAIVYFSDVDARCGATFVAPESVPATIRWMAESPDGVDLVERSSGPRIVGSCQRIEELTGKAGDVFLLHPLMVHSSSANTSGRVRYMSNPMVYLREPLRFDRTDEAAASPLERSFRRALGYE